jgi:hypothetical protein
MRAPHHDSNRIAGADSQASRVRVPARGPAEPESFRLGGSESPLGSESGPFEVRLVAGLVGSMGNEALGSRQFRFADPGPFLR